MGLVRTTPHESQELLVDDHPQASTRVESSNAKQPGPVEVENQSVAMTEEAPLQVAPPLEADTKPKPPVMPQWMLYKMINELVNSAAGYDEKILRQYGTPTDEKRRRNIGRAILVATAVGSLGWFAKIAGSYPGWMALPVALTVGILYAVLSYSLESFFASNVDPYASQISKLTSLFGRVMLSAVIAFAGALPWVTVSLKGAVELEMSKISIQEQSSLRKSLDDVYGVSASTTRVEGLQADLDRLSGSLANLPAPIQSLVDTAQACKNEQTTLAESTGKKTAAWNSRLAGLDRMSASPDKFSPQAISNERSQIRKAMLKAEEELSAKQIECKDKLSSAEKSKSEHIDFVTQQRESSQMILASLRKEEAAVSAKLMAEKERIDSLVARTTRENSSAEMSALLRVIQTQTYAQMLAGIIFLGLLLIDALPLTLRLFARPGPYDVEKRADDRIRRMHAEGRWMQARMIHEVRSLEIESAELRKMVQSECRPHIRSMALGDVKSFLHQAARA
jgi:hypothetical protein